MPACLRPLSPGEILDQTFRLYRRFALRWLAFALPPCLLWSLLPSARIGDSEAATALHVSAIAALLAALGVVPIAWAAAGRWLGHHPARRPALIPAWRRLFRRAPAVSLAISIFFLCSLLAFFAADGSELLFNALPSVGHTPFAQMLVDLADYLSGSLGVIGFSLAVTAPLLALPCAILEDANPLASLRRGFQLAGGARRTLVFLLLAAIAVQIPVTTLTNIAADIVFSLTPVRISSSAPIQFLHDGIEKWSLALGLPIPGIGLALAWCNQKVIREGWDIELLLRDLPTVPDALTPEQFEK